MKLFVYVMRNALRNKLRSVLTILSVGFSLAMMTVMYGYMAMMAAGAAEAEKSNRLVVMNTQGFSGKLPIANVDRVRSTDGVLAAVPYSWYGGIYKDEKMPFAQFGTDPAEVFNVWTEFEIDPKELADWQENRQGCVVDRDLAERRGWKVGDRVPLKGTIYPFDLDLVISGIFDSPTPTQSLWFNWYYLDEALKQRSAVEAGNAGTIFAKAESATAIPGICKTIDDRFASSENPTRSQTEAAFAQMFADMLGNIRAFIRNIGLAVMFSLTLVAGNSMAMSMRERTTEIAVLKAIGFARLRVLAMIWGESVFISLIGGAVGVALGCGIIQFLHVTNPQFFPFDILQLTGVWMLSALGISAVIGLASGLVPAVNAARLSVVDGLRRVA